MAQPLPKHFTLMLCGLVTPILRHNSGSTLAQVMACCLMARSHYLNQCQIIINKIRPKWHIRSFTATIIKSHVIGLVITILPVCVCVFLYFFRVFFLSFFLLRSISPQPLHELEYTSWATKRCLYQDINSQTNRQLPGFPAPWQPDCCHPLIQCSDMALTGTGATGPTIYDSFIIDKEWINVVLL